MFVPWTATKAGEPTRRNATCETMRGKTWRAPIIAASSAQMTTEADILRHNTERLNEKLSRYMDEVSIHDDGAVSDMVRLSKEIRESIKDLTSFQKQWVEPEEKMVANTINILKVEMAKESPDTWKRVKEALLTQEGDEIDISGMLQQEEGA